MLLPAGEDQERPRRPLPAVCRSATASVPWAPPPPPSARQRLMALSPAHAHADGRNESLERNKSRGRQDRIVNVLPGGGSPERPPPPPPAGLPFGNGRLPGGAPSSPA